MPTRKINGHSVPYTGGHILATAEKTGYKVLDDAGFWYTEGLQCLVCSLCQSVILPKLVPTHGEKHKDLPNWKHFRQVPHEVLRALDGIRKDRGLWDDAELPKFRPPIDNPVFPFLEKEVDGFLCQMRDCYYASRTQLTMQNHMSAEHKGQKMNRYNGPERFTACKVQQLWADHITQRVSAFSVSSIPAEHTGRIYENWSSRFSKKFGDGKDFVPPTVVETTDAASSTKFAKETGWPERLSRYSTSTINKMVSLLNASRATNNWLARLRDATEYFFSSVTPEMLQSQLGYNLRRELFHWKQGR